jgi:hypothetical protein
MKIRNIGSNQTEVNISNGVVLVSYETPVAAIIDGVRYRTQKKWSVTTSRHINQWLDGAQAETKPQAFFDSLL